jgi:hypothetical protein
MVEREAKFFAHHLEGKVHRYDVPGIHGVNLLLKISLGGGGITSLRLDYLGKSYAQVLILYMAFTRLWGSVFQPAMLSKQFAELKTVKRLRIPPFSKLTNTVQAG